MIARVKKSVNHSRTIQSMRETSISFRHSGKMTAHARLFRTDVCDELRLLKERDIVMSVLAMFSGFQWTETGSIFHKGNETSMEMTSEKL